MRSAQTAAPALKSIRSHERFQYFFLPSFMKPPMVSSNKNAWNHQKWPKINESMSQKKMRCFYLKPNNFLVLIITLIFNIYSRLNKTCMACDECSSFAILIFSTILLCGITAGTITEREVCCFLWRCQYRCIKRSKYMNKYIMARTTCPNHIVYSLNILDLTHCLGHSHWYFKIYFRFCPMHVANHIIYR